MPDGRWHQRTPTAKGGKASSSTMTIPSPMTPPQNMTRVAMPTTSSMPSTTESMTWNPSTPPRKTQGSCSAASWSVIPGSPGSQVSLASPGPNPRDMRCLCQLPAQRLTVKKPGPTQGRHFYNCPRHICQYFEWDPIEVKVIQELDSPGSARMTQGSLPSGTPPDVQEKIELEMWKKKLHEQEKELSEKQASIEQLRQSSEEMAVKTQMEGQALLMQQHQAHAAETQQLRDQLIWLSCVAGPERLEQARTDPNFHQEMVNQAMEYKKMFEEQGAGPTN